MLEKKQETGDREEKEGKIGLDRVKTDFVGMSSEERSLSNFTTCSMLPGKRGERKGERQKEGESNVHQNRPVLKAFDEYDAGPERYWS